MTKNQPANARDIRDAGLIPGLEDPLEEGMATHSSILAWEMPWTEEPGRLPSMGFQSVTAQGLNHHPPGPTVPQPQQPDFYSLFL